MEKSIVEIDLVLLIQIEARLKSLQALKRDIWKNYSDPTLESVQSIIKSYVESI